MENNFQNIELVSVVVPTHNRAQLLKATITSILNQKYNNLEIIIVDDGSDDETENTVKLFNDKRIVYYKAARLANLGKLRNIGISLSKGRYIAFCDDDDIWLPGKLEKQIPLLDKYDFVCSNASIINIDGEIIQPLKNLWELKDKLLETKYLLLGNCIITSSVILKKELLYNRFIEKDSTNSAEDYELWLKLSTYCSIFYLNEALIFFRRHSNTSSFDEKYIYKGLLHAVIKIISAYKSSPDKEIKLNAKIGEAIQRKELCKILINIPLYKDFILQFFKFTVSLLNPFVFNYFLKRKIKNFINNLFI
jgi:glycosyltransferase involved in cell wall biosynthesis